MKALRVILGISSGLFLVGVFIIAVFIAVLILGSPSISQRKLSQVHNGMTTDQVTTLLGQPQNIGHSEITGLTGEVYYYTSSYANAQVIFVNGQVFVTHYYPNPGGGIRFL